MSTLLAFVHLFCKCNHFFSIQNMLYTLFLKEKSEKYVKQVCFM